MAGKVKHEPTDHARNYAQVAYEFALEASRDRKGKKHCKFVRLAAKRHLDDLLKKKSWPYRFDEWYANDVCDFAEKFPHVEGTWDSDTIELEPSQVFILCVVFGWRRKEDDGRRFSAVYVEMARKGAKSTLAAIVSHYCLSCEGERGPQVIIGATTREQADKVFKPAKMMADKTPEYREAFGVEVWSNSISCAESGGFIQPINAKSSTQDGWNPHVGILDELHAHKDRGLYDVIKSAFGARKNALLWIITTAGYNVDGVCYEQRTLVRQILEGAVEADHYFGIIFTLDEEDDPLDETKWIKANPMIGVTPTWESMRSYAKEAAASPGTMGEFKTKRLNIWTSAKGGWLNTEQWKLCDGSVNLDELVAVPAYGGVDLASVSDITAFVLVWYVGGRLKVYPKFYLPEEATRLKDGHNRDLMLMYQQWVEQGYLTTTPGEVTDYDWIERDVDEAMDRFNVQEIAFDRHNASQLVTNLLKKEAPMLQFAQGATSFNPPMVELERLLKSGKIDHSGNPVLAWMASNIVARYDVNANMAPDKKNSNEKIDGIVALLMALGRAQVHEEPPGSPWEDPDFTMAG